MTPTFFTTPADWRAWLERHHAEHTEVLVGYYKRDTSRPSLTWPESVDQALCFGWIDGVRRRIDEHSYCIRFTPRKARGIWSAVNIARVEELTAQGLMKPEGLKAFQARTEDRSKVYAYEQATPAALPEAYDRQLKANKKAWAFFQKQPPGYQRTVLHWVTSAKKEDTQLKRLATLIQDCAEGRTVKQFTRAPAASR